MPRISLCAPVILLVTAACAAPMNSGARAPVPASVAGDPPPPRSIPVESAPLLPVPPPSVLDSLARARAFADSVADAVALEQLEDAVAPATGEIGDLGITWDIDVTTYANHDRVRYYLDFFQGRARDRMAVWLTRMPVYEPMIRERLQSANLPADLVYLALIESGFSNTAVSRSKAVGMWQFMAGTGKMFGLRVDRWVDDRRDPVKATDAAVKYLTLLTGQFGSPYLAAAAYNGGPGRVSRGLERVTDAQVDPENGALFSDAAFFQLSDTRYIRPETKDYVPKLIAAALISKQPELYGFQPLPVVPPFRTDSVLVRDAIGLDVIARLGDTSAAAIRELNPQYLRNVTPPGRASLVRVPVGLGEKIAAGLVVLPAAERGTFQEHVVRRGESLGVIARRYGVSVGELEDANPRVKPRSLQVGQVLVVPIVGGAAPAPDRATGVATASTHTVRAGETLSAIASAHGVRVFDLRAWNNLASDMIRAGQRLALRPEENTGIAAAPAGSKSRTHVVRPGETLSELAERYGVTVKALMAANHLRSTAIRSGTRLRIPA